MVVVAAERDFVHPEEGVARGVGMEGYEDFLRRGWGGWGLHGGAGGGIVEGDLEEVRGSGAAVGGRCTWPQDVWVRGVVVDWGKALVLALG